MGVKELETGSTELTVAAIKGSTASFKILFDHIDRNNAKREERYISTIKNEKINRRVIDVIAILFVMACAGFSTWIFMKAYQNIEATNKIIKEAAGDMDAILTRSEQNMLKREAAFDEVKEAKIIYQILSEMQKGR